MTNIQKINQSGHLSQQYPPLGSQQKTATGDRRSAVDMPQDRVTLSKAALAAKKAQPAAEKAIKSQDELSNEQQQVVNELKKRDVEVKAHEQAHMAAGGPVVQGGASYQYQNGPDGKMYAVGGEVKIDASPERTPEATIRKMQQIRRAALAPSQPSSTDRAVAAQALQMEAQARMEKNEKSREQDQGDLNQSIDTSSKADTSAKDQPQHSAAGRHIDLVA